MENIYFISYMISYFITVGLCFYLVNKKQFTQSEGEFPYIMAVGTPIAQNIFLLYLIFGLDTPKKEVDRSTIIYMKEEIELLREAYDLGKKADEIRNKINNF